MLGDVYHCQDEKVGSYNHFGITGHYVLRLINKNHFPRLEVLGKYPNEYFADSKGSIKKRDKEHFAIIDDRIFHSMYLQRSTKGSILPYVLNRQKYKIELGIPIKRSLLPEVYIVQHTDLVPDVLNQRSIFYFIIACILTPVKKLKRKLVHWFLPAGRRVNQWTENV